MPSDEMHNPPPKTGTKAQPTLTIDRKFCKVTMPPVHVVLYEIFAVGQKRFDEKLLGICSIAFDVRVVTVG